MQFAQSNQIHPSIQYTQIIVHLFICQLKVGAIFGPRSLSASYSVMDICDAKEIPYISVYRDDASALKSSVLNMYPSLDSINLMLLDYINATALRDQITILYESPLWLKSIVKILELNNRLGNRISLNHLKYEANSEYRETLQEIRDSNNTNIILECSLEVLPGVLQQAMQVGLITKHYKWIIMNLDAYSIDFEPYRYSGTNITVFRSLNVRHPLFSYASQAENKQSDDSQQAMSDMCANSVENSISIPVYPDKFSQADEKCN